MECGFNVGYRLTHAELSIRRCDGDAPEGYSIILDADIRAWVSTHYADLLDSWAGLPAAGDRLDLACRLAYRGDILQWNGYPAAWWMGVFALMEKTASGGLKRPLRLKAEMPGIPIALVRAVLRLRWNPNQPAALLSRIVLRLTLAAGFVVGMAEYGAAWAKHRRFGHRLQISAPLLVFIFADDDNTTKHVYRWLRTLAPSDFTPYVLGSPLRALRSRREWAGSSLPVFSEFCRGLWLGLKDLLRFSSLASSSADFALYGGRPSWTRIFLNGSRLLRQGVHRTRLAACAAHANTALYSLQGAEGLLLDVSLQQKGIRSIHWLHGILASRRNLDGLSDLALTKSNADAQELNAFGHYKKAINAFRPSLAPAPSFSDADSATAPYILALTTIFHPTRVPPDEIKLKELIDYLSIVIGLAQQLRCKVIWRPHPFEVANNRMALVSQLLDSKIISVDSKTALRQQIDGARHILTTISGTILDVLDAGRVPAVYSGAFYEDAGIPAGIPSKLFFNTRPEAEAVLALLKDQSSCHALFSQLTSSLAFDRNYLPAGTSFDAIANN